MVGSLRDQLLKAGVVSKQKIKQVEQEQRKQRKQAPNLPDAEAAARAAAIQAAQEEKRQRDRELEDAKRREQLERARQAEIRQLIERHRIQPPKDAAVRYYFTRENRIQSLWITQDLQSRLVAGSLRLVAFDNAVHLLPVDISERVRDRDDRLLIANADTDAEHARVAAEESEYADYPIPDDLRW